ncbi:MAG: hypothetical protein VX577_02205 [Verrucomicrobiota bacterium]|nr:hypothetical protein [Verrucomicrobiota bacterium]
MRGMDQLIILRVIVSIGLIMMGLEHDSEAQLVAEPLSSTSQINPDQLPVIVAANMIFSGQPPGIEGSVNGVEFEDVIWGNETNLQNDVEISGSVAGAIRSANVLSSLRGEGADVLAAIANSINFYNVNTDGTLTITGISPGSLVLVQMITSDAASSFNNWGGSFSVSVFDTETQENRMLGDFDAGTEPDNLDAQIVTFEASSDSNGVLQIGIDQTRGGQHAGIAALMVYLMDPTIVGVSSEGVDFIGSIGEGEVVGILTTEDQKKNVTHSYELVSGQGDTHNDKFLIVGQELRSNGYDFSMAKNEMIYSVRVRSTDAEDEDRFFEEVIEFIVHRDSDDDKLWDEWEFVHAGPENLNALSGDGDSDADNDSLSDLEEFEVSLGEFSDIDPLSADTDEDGISDADELNGSGERPATDPTSADSDDDGLSDGIETGTGFFVSANDTGSNPLNSDTDADGLRDSDEVLGKNPRGFESDPNRKDSDGDGFSDLDEVLIGSDPSDSGDVPDIFSAQLTNTAQINPSGLDVLVAANMIFSGQRPGIGGSVNGVVFEDVFWGDEMFLTNGVSIQGTVAGGIRTANTLGSISGEDADVLATIANSINFYNVQTDGNITFNGLPAGLPVSVQMITSDAASSVNNWGGVFSLSVIDTVTQRSAQIVTFDAGTEPNNFDAQLVTFSAEVDGNGTLQVFVDQTRPGHHAGISGIVVLAAGQLLPLQINLLTIDEDRSGVTIEWDSRANKVYAIEVSEDLKLWEELDDNVISEGDITTFTDTQVPVNSSRRFYRVHEMEP